MLVNPHRRTQIQIYPTISGGRNILQWSQEQTIMFSHVKQTQVIYSKTQKSKIKFELLFLAYLGRQRMKPGLSLPCLHKQFSQPMLTMPATFVPLYLPETVGEESEVKGASEGCSAGVWVGDRGLLPGYWRYDAGSWTERFLFLFIFCWFIYFTEGWSICGWAGTCHVD